MWQAPSCRRHGAKPGQGTGFQPHKKPRSLRDTHVHTHSSVLQASSLPEDAVVLSAFSSGGGYLVTAQRPGKAADGSMSKNLKVGGGTRRRGGRRE